MCALFVFRGRYFSLIYLPFFFSFFLARRLEIRHSDPASFVFVSRACRSEITCQEGESRTSLHEFILTELSSYDVRPNYLD